MFHILSERRICEEECDLSACYCDWLECRREAIRNACRQTWHTMKLCDCVYTGHLRPLVLQNYLKLLWDTKHCAVCWLYTPFNLCSNLCHRASCSLVLFFISTAYHVRLFVQNCVSPPPLQQTNVRVFGLHL